MNSVLVRHIVDLGFHPLRASLIHAFVGGSALHGVKLEGKDDLDIYGVFIEEPRYILGLDRFEHFVTSTSSEAERNTADDIDVSCYSLRKLATLALKGNPTILQFFFTPAGAGDIAWSRVIASKELFLSKQCSHSIKGFADAQLHRMAGERGTGKHGQRDELVVKFGYDTKSAMHSLRVLLEGIDLLRKGWIEFPRPKEQCDWLLSVRRGEWSMDRVLLESKRLFTQIKEAEASSKLPDEPDRAAVDKFLAEMYLESWGR